MPADHTFFDHHRLAAEHHEKAAQHHREVIRLQADGDVPGAFHHAYAAIGHGHHAHHHGAEAAKLMASGHVKPEG